MPQYYFMSNNAAMFDKSSSQIVGTTLAGTFDAAVVDSSVLLPAGSSGGSGLFYFAGMPVIVGGPSLTTKVYGHFELNCVTSATVTSTNPTASLLRIRNNAGQVVFRVYVDGAGGQFRCQFWNGAAFVNVGPSFTLTLTGTTAYDFEFLSGAGGTFVLRIAGSAVPIVSVAGMNVAVDNCAVVDIGNATNGLAYVSQGILADFDLRGAKLPSLRPSGNGFHTDGTGTFTDVNTVVTDDTTGVGLPLSGNRKSFIKNALITTGMVIDAVSVNIKSGVSGGVVNNARPIVRRAATTTAAGAYAAPSLGLQQAMLPLYTDPSTGLAWTVANFNASELGFEARP